MGAFEMVVPANVSTPGLEKSGRCVLEDVLPGRNPSDEQLMREVQENHPDGLRKLFDRYSGMVFSIALRVLRDRGESEELVQDVFIHLFQRCTQFDPARGSAKAWVMQIAHHRALDRKAYLERRAFYSSTEVYDEHYALFQGHDLERMIADREELDRLQRAFCSLSLQQRTTLQLHFLAGLELKEIALQLHDSLGNIRHYLYRGLKRLRDNELVQALQRERQRTVQPADEDHFCGSGTRSEGHA